MRLAHFYPPSVRREKNTKGNGFIRTFLFAGIFMVFMPFVSSASIPPFPVNGNLQEHTICSNLPVDISEWLKVFDVDITETITWTVLVENNGTVSGDGTTAPAGGSSSIPVGMTFTPDPGFSNANFTIQVDDGDSPPVYIVVNLNINAAPTLTLGAFPSVCRGVTSARLTFSDLTNVGPDTAVVTYTGAMQTWTVPANVTSVRFDMMGASGGNDDYSGAPNPGKGGRIQGTLSVAPNTDLNIFVGGRGGDGNPLGAIGGFNGGGNAFYYFYGGGGAGGGATDIRVGGTSLAHRRVVAGGGGGNGADNNPVLTGYFGGNGGGTIGGVSDNNNNTPPSNSKGGTQAVGGAPSTYTGWASGAFGTLGMGGNSSPQGVSGAGGGGYYGGGGGIWTGGGGGSSYFDPTYAFSVTHTQGAHEGDGVVNLYYVNPGTYTIIWDNHADVVGGFENVAEALLPTNFEFNIAVPGGAPADTYHGKLFIENINCRSVEYDIEVTVKPTPTVDPIADQNICHGGMTTDISPSGPVAGGQYSWVNDNPGIGLAAAGEGHIAAFTTINSTALPVEANITVTPAANGCIGDPVVFHIVDNPIPTLNSTTSPASICNNTLFSYLPNSLTPGTSFDWNRPSITGIFPATNSGAGNPNETLVNTTVDPITVTYVYTLAANTCTNVQNVNVVVNPTPALTSSTNPPLVCNGEPFIYTPESSSTMATLTWARPVAAGISNAAASGTGTINETLNNTTTTPKTVTYVITLAIDGCSYTEEVTVTVNPPLNLTSSTAFSVCDSDLIEYNPTTPVSVATINWSRGEVTGIANAPATGVGNINEALYNTTADPITVPYVYTLAAFGCTNTAVVNITVNPSPKLTSTLTPPGICTNTLFSYSSSSATVGTTFQWSRDTVRGITNPIAPVTTGVSFSELLVSTADTTLNVIYRITGTANGCANSQEVVVKVFPLPKISNDVSALAVCDSALFSFAPTSITPGASFSWTRAYEAGISNINAAGTGNPNERLNNTTYISVPATYVYTITANGCSNSQNVIVQVRPSPILTSNTATICSGAPFTYDPVSYTTLTEFAWSRTNSPGITPPSKSGTGSISDTLTQTTSGKVVVVYDFDLKIFGCVNKQKVNVTVDPAPAVPVIGTHPGATLCNSARAMNFGANAPAADGYSYSWSATNATVIGTGSSTQFALVSFNSPGTATVTLTTRIGATTCTSKTDHVVTIGNTMAETPEVIYFNGQFICKQIEQASYQWGYDDRSTLDSNIIAGETNQNYGNEYPDFNNRYYWVMTVRNGCTQKTYYNKPTGVENISADVASIKIYPNPATNYVNVEVSRSVTGNIRLDVFNMLGQQLQNVQADNNKAQINVADLPAGAYIVDCYSDGLKVAAARFIKN